MIKLFSAVLLALGLALSGFFISQGFVKSRQPNRFVQVKGLAEQVVKSDQAIFNINFHLSHNELSELYQALSESQQKIRTFLTQEGFKADEIGTHPVNVVDNKSNSFNQNNDTPRYTAESGITVATSQVDLVYKVVQKTGELVDKGVVLTSANAQYRYTSLNDIKPDMLSKATQNAYEAAQSFAKNAHLKVGHIRRAVQGLFTIEDAGSNYDSGTTVDKKVRIVTTVDYELL